MNALRRLRDLPGVLVHDVPRYSKALSRGNNAHRSAPEGWISLCNRNERLLQQPGEPGVVCDWTWGSSLHAPQILPSLGRRLMRVALDQWPIGFAAEAMQQAGPPRVSFVIALGGEQRVPHLQMVLRSLFAQQGAACEIIVVDQTPEPQAERLPPGIVYKHLDKAHLQQGWYKSWAFNVGARLARADIVVFHDGDICVPLEYAQELVRCFSVSECAAASLQRLLFYLGPNDSDALLSGGGLHDDCTPALIRQNWKGGTIAVRRETFLRLGGFDEGFVDWGGEDDEFYDRCAEVGHCRSGYLPFLHVWHPPQPQRKVAENANISRVLPKRLAMKRHLRIAELSARRWGLEEGPDPAQRYG